MTQATEKDIGKWCKFWDKDTNKFICRLNKIYSNRYVPYGHMFMYQFCTPLTDEQIKILGLEE